MRWAVIISCGLLGVLFGMFEYYLFNSGIVLDSVLSSIGPTLSITDIMIFTFLLWVVAGLWLGMRD